MTAPPTALSDGRIDWDAYVPSEETRALAETAREQFAALARPEDVRHATAGERGSSVWATLNESGYPLIGLAEEFDGIGSLLDVTVVLEEAGRALLAAPLLTHALSAQLLQSSDSMTSALAASSLAFASATDDELLLLDGQEADYAVTVRSDDDGCIIEVFAVSKSPRTHDRPVDPSRPWSTVDLPPAAVSTARGDDEDAVLAAGRLCVAADLAGVAGRALEGSISHALAREQFDRPIGSFQAVKHQLADAYVLLERARSLILGGAVAVSAARTSPEAARLGMLAKAAAADAAARCTALHTQLLGAMGLTFESESPLAIRRARQTIPVLGGPGELYARVAERAATGVY